MKLAVFVSDYRTSVDTIEKLKAEKLGIILVGNGVFHATVKENGNASPILNSSADLYALSEDLETRGLSAKVDSKVKVVKYGDVVDLLFNDYDKTAWI